MIDLDFFKNFLEKYKITNYNRINYPSTSREAKRQLNREIIFNIDDNCYYKIINTKLTLLDVHYFLNNAYFPNHFVSSIYDTELSLWIVNPAAIGCPPYFSKTDSQVLRASIILNSGMLLALARRYSPTPDTAITGL